MLEEVKNRTKKIAIIGMGYVGRPLALAFSTKYRVVGFDIDEEQIRTLESLPTFTQNDLELSCNEKDLRDISLFIVCVPTDIDKHKVPDLKPLKQSCRLVGKKIQKGGVVIFESTVFPGCTEEECIPIVESVSGLKADRDFGYGYSPERINIGDASHHLEDIIKVVSGNSPSTLAAISALYASVIPAGVFEASSIRVAEAAKVIENTQRDINIALMNELAMIFDKMGLDTLEVISVASTKWNFHTYKPGLVGGHCIGVDPYYLTYKAQQLGRMPSMILSGRKINEEVPSFIAKKLIKTLIQHRKNPGTSHLLFLGVAFKENVSDARNSKAIDLIHELVDYGLNVDVHDPLVDKDQIRNILDVGVVDSIQGSYDAVVIAVAHDAYRSMSTEFYLDLLDPSSPILFDIKGILAAPDHGFYWRL